MGGLRGKLLLTLIIYFAGFATAIYYQAPAMDGLESAMKDFPGTGADKDSSRAEVTAENIRENFSKYLSIAEEKASQVGALIKARLDED